MQALQGLHAKRRGVCDLKPDNLMIEVAADGSFQRCTVLDLGGSVAYNGQRFLRVCILSAVPLAWSPPLHYKLTNRL